MSLFFGKKKKANAFSRTDIGKILNNETPFAIKEAYNSVRTNLLFSSKGEQCPVFVVTSALPNDGKTLNCANLALSFAQNDKRVLLIDGDMRNPTIHKYFNHRSKDGLSEILAGMSEPVYKDTHYEYLSLITAGTIPPNPAELLASEKMRDFLSQQREKFDYIFIDSPPVEVVTDATVLTDFVTGYVFIVQADSSDTVILHHAVETMQQVGAKILGFVLNKLNSKTNGYYSKYRYYSKYNYKYRYSYNYHYGKSEGQEE